MSSRFSNLEFHSPAGESELSSPPVTAPQSELRQFVAHDRDSSYHVRKAETHEMNGFLEDALRSYSAALGEDPLLLAAWVGQLLMLLDLGEYKEADLWAGKALERFPDNPEIWACQSVALRRMGHDRRARELNDLALAGRGDKPVVWVCRGEVLAGGSNAAIAGCFRNAMQQTAKPGITGLRVGRICVRYEKNTIGLEFLTEVVGRCPTGAALWYCLGLTQEGIGLRNDAERSFRQAADLCPANKQYVACAKRGYYRHDGFVNALLRRVIGR